MRAFFHSFHTSYKLLGEKSYLDDHGSKITAVKQKLRKLIMDDNRLALQFFKLAINDALGGFHWQDLEPIENDLLLKGFQELTVLQKEARNSNCIYVSDLIAFVGAEALESVGIGRIILQIGRIDERSSHKKAHYIPWQEFESHDADLGSTFEKVILAFANTGLELREIVILLAAIGEMRRVISVAEQERLSRVVDHEEEEEDDIFEEQPFVSSTATDNLSTGNIGRADFGARYVTNLYQHSRSGNTSDSNDHIGRLIISDHRTKNLLSKYVGNDALFKKEVAEVYLKLTSNREELSTWKY